MDQKTKERTLADIQAKLDMMGHGGWQALQREFQSNIANLERRIINEVKTTEQMSFTRGQIDVLKNLLALERGLRQQMALLTADPKQKEEEDRNPLEE